MPQRRVTLEEVRAWWQLYKQGRSMDDIAKMFNRSKSTVHKYLSALRTMIDEGLSEDEAFRRLAEEYNLEVLSSDLARELGRGGEEEAGGGEAAATAEAGAAGEQGFTIERVYSSPEDVSEDVIESIPVKTAVRIAKRIVLNPYVLLLYDYVRSKGYQGSLDDFIVDCVRRYFELHGLKVAILRVRRGGSREAEAGQAR